MTETTLQLIQTIITAVLSVSGCYKIISYRLKKIEERLDRHNNYAEKFGECQKDIAVINETLKNIESNLDEVKRKYGN